MEKKKSTTSNVNTIATITTVNMGSKEATTPTKPIWYKQLKQAHLCKLMCAFPYEPDRLLHCHDQWLKSEKEWTLRAFRSWKLLEKSADVNDDIEEDAKETARSIVQNEHPPLTANVSDELNEKTERVCNMLAQFLQLRDSVYDGNQPFAPENDDHCALTETRVSAPLAQKRLSPKAHVSVSSSGAKPTDNKRHSGRLLFAAAASAATKRK